MAHENGNEVVQAEVVPVSLAEIEKFDRGTVDTQITTAKQYPRNVGKCIDEAMSMALIDEETAESCFYVLPRKNDEGRQVKIEGPGVRLAEIVASCWGNMRIAMDVLGESEDRRFVIARGFAWDLEKNIALAATVRRRITNRSGKRYSDDMIQTTGLAGAAIAMRNCVFKVVPMTVTNAIYEAAKKLAVGTTKSLQSKRETVLDRLMKYGVTKERVLSKLEKNSAEEITLEDIQTLIGFGTALKEGADPEDIFPHVGPAQTEAPKTLSDKVAAKAAEATKKPEQPTMSFTKTQPREPGSDDE